MRISTTTLESFRLWSDPEQDWMSEDELIATIRGEFTPTPAVRLGLAFGRVLENPDAYRVKHGYICNDFLFADAVMDEPLALIDRRGLFEVKGTKEIAGCTVVAKADHLYGVRISEFKTTCSTFDFDKYAHSCQWRLMLDIFQAKVCTYHVFLLNDHGNGVVELRGIETFNVFPYPSMVADNVHLVQRFKEYVIAKGLDGLLKQRQEAAA